MKHQRPHQWDAGKGLVEPGLQKSSLSLGGPAATAQSLPWKRVREAVTHWISLQLPRIPFRCSSGPGTPQKPEGK